MVPRSNVGMDLCLIAYFTRPDVGVPSLRRQDCHIGRIGPEQICCNLLSTRLPPPGSYTSGVRPGPVVPSAIAYSSDCPHHTGNKDLVMPPSIGRSR